MGNSIGSMLKNSEQENNRYYKKQFDSYVLGDSFSLSISESLKAIEELGDYKKFSEKLFSENAGDKNKVSNYIKKQNLDFVKEAINGNYEQAYYAILIAETMQGAAKNNGMKMEPSDILPINESLELVSKKLTSEEKSIANTIKETNLESIVNGVAYQNGRLGSKDYLETNIAQVYKMSLGDISKKDYMQSYGGFSIAKGLDDILQKEYTNQEIKTHTRNVAPQSTLFSERQFGSATRHI